MAERETVNTHLQKVLSHRNYIHHVSLQKQLNIYERQKKLVEKELLQITQVRQALQQINKSSPNSSPSRLRKKDAVLSPSKSKHLHSSLQVSGGKIIKESRGLKEHRIVENDRPNEESANHLSHSSKDNNQTMVVNGEKIVEEEGRIKKDCVINEKREGSENERNSCFFSNVLPKKEPSIASPGKVPSNTEHKTQGVMSRNSNLKSNAESVSNQVEIRIPKNPSEKQDSLNENTRNKREVTQPMSGAENEKFFIRRPPYIKSSSAPNLTVHKLEVVEIGGKENVNRLPRSSTMIEKHDSYAGSDEDLYRKTLMTNHAHMRGRQAGKSETFCLPNSPTGIVSEDRFSYCDDEFSKKDSLTTHANAVTKFPSLVDPTGETRKAGKTFDVSKNIHCSESRSSHETNASSIRSIFPNSEVCFLQKTRARSRTVCDPQRFKAKTALNTTETKREKKNFRSIFRDNDVCLINRPRTRAATMSNMESDVVEHYRPKADMHSDSKQLGPAGDSAWLADTARPRAMTVAAASELNTFRMEHCSDKSQRKESVCLTEDESTAIKGKFRQIGHSVLAIALMKRLGKK